jgi:hypothetical protein
VLKVKDAFAGGAGAGNKAPVILSIWAEPETVVLPAGTRVGTVAQDPEGQALIYTWAKVSGPGSVSFAPNGTARASESAVAFSRAGDYRLRVKVRGRARITS